jgi:hypothetical protein
MSKFYFVVLSFFIFQFGFSQKLIYTSNGNVSDGQNKRLSPSEVRSIIGTSETILIQYEFARLKKTVGNIMFYGGLSMMTTDLLRALNSNVVYPGSLTYIGAAVFVASIPIKLGYSSKIEKAISDFNNLNKVGENNIEIEKFEFITNQNGIGFRLTLN